MHGCNGLITERSRNIHQRWDTACLATCLAATELVVVSTLLFWSVVGGGNSIDTCEGLSAVELAGAQNNGKSRVRRH